MWFSFWRSRDRFTLDELRYLVEQLQKIQVVNEINKDFIIEALRSIAELVTYGDQHDASFFEFFMEKQIMGEFVRILRISRVTQVALQLLQTMSIMIQNLKSEHAIYYIFSNEHINSLILYSFDFRNEELLSYYISFLRAISGRLNKNTISLLVTTKNEEVTSFPLYTEAIRFAFHEENMVRIAVRSLILNVYHVGDENVNRYLSRAPLSDYFLNLIKTFQKQCLSLDQRVSDAFKNPLSSDSSSVILGVDEIEDSLYYFSDVISAGVPELERLITENILQLLIFKLVIPSLKEQNNGSQIGPITSLYLLCCILHIVKTKELASTIATAFFCPLDCFLLDSEVKPNGDVPGSCVTNEHHEVGNSVSVQMDESSQVSELASCSFPEGPLQGFLCSLCNGGSQPSLREMLLTYIINGDDIQVLGSLSLLATLLQTKELDESVLDGLGILPQRRQQKKLLLQALVGECSDEERLFSRGNSLTRDCLNSELDQNLQKFKAQNGFSFCCGESGVNPQVHRWQVLNALVGLFCRSNISSLVLWVGGWLLRQLLPHSEAEFSNQHLKQLKDSHKYSITLLYGEIKGSWCDHLLPVLVDEWKNCRKAMEASSPQKDLRNILMPLHKKNVDGDSSFAAGKRMCETLKVFVLRHQLVFFSHGDILSDLSLEPSPSITQSSRAKVAGLDALIPKPGTEIVIANSIPCKIAFERGKERQFSFLAISKGMSGWLLLVDELPLKPRYGIVRVAAPLAGSNPKVDDKHKKWLHLRIRPSTLPFMDPSKYDVSTKGKSKVVVDGRWILAFRDESACRSAESMILEEMHLQSSEVENQVKGLLNLNELEHIHT